MCIREKEEFQSLMPFCFLPENRDFWEDVSSLRFWPVKIKEQHLFIKTWFQFFLIMKKKDCIYTHKSQSLIHDHKIINL